MSGKRGPSKRSQRAAAVRAHALRADDTSAYTLSAEYDDEGVWFYQAYNEGIADWAQGGGTRHPRRPALQYDEDDLDQAFVCVDAL